MKLHSRKVAVLLILATSLCFTFKNRQAELKTTASEDVKDLASTQKDIFSFWKQSGSQRYAIIAEDNAIHKIRRLKEFQSVTHYILLRFKLDFPRKIEEVETFMKKVNLKPEYWKTTVPSIFDPRGRLIPSYDGLWLEFGVKAGGSIVYPAVIHRSKTIHGFDSFEGLPSSKFAKNTPWQEGKHRVDISDDRIVSLTRRLPNVVLHKGWFNTSCSKFLASSFEKISFVHIDGDLYESARDVLQCLLHFRSRVMNGCVIVFDNFVWLHEETSFVKNHEVKAFYEFLSTSEFMATIIGSVRHSAAFYLFKE